MEEGGAARGYMTVILCRRSAFVCVLWSNHAIFTAWDFLSLYGQLTVA